MNVFKCNHTPCTSVAFGIGNAIGLKSIGWSVTQTVTVNGLQKSTITEIRCPVHHAFGYDSALRDAGNIQHKITHDECAEYIPDL
jgi:hypothetical protein